MSRPKTQPLGEVADLLSGGTPHKGTPAYWGGDVSWLTPRDMGAWTGETANSVTEAAIGNGTRLAPADACFVVVRGMSLHNEIRVVRAGTPITFNQDIKAIVPKESISADYLFQVLVSKKPELLGLVESAGHGTGRLPTDQLLALAIPRFDEKQEQAIAAVLSALDDKIDLNQRMNETLEGLARAIFKSWFVDFDPVHAKAEGRDTDLAPGLAALFPDRFGDNGLPEGWEEKPFSELVEIIGGGTPKTSEPEYWHGDIPWFSVADTPSGSDTFVFQTEKNITPQGLSGSSARLVCRGTTIITARGTVGKLAIAGCDMAFNQSCYALRSLKDLHPFFTYLAAQYVVKQLKSMAHGSVFSTITRQTFENVNFPTSSVEMRDAFEKLSAPLFERISVSVQESQTLAALRDLLLPKLMSGEIRIRDAEKLAGEAGA